MLKRHVQVAAAVLAFALAPVRPAAAQQAALGPSSWTNQSGSTLYIQHVAPNGQITGFYVNRAAGYRCQNSPYPVTGWSYGNIISFSVVWVNPRENCQSITGWTGFLSRDGNTMTTRWYLVVNGQQTFAPGQDIFTRDTQTTSGSLVAPGATPQP